MDSPSEPPRDNSRMVGKPYLTGLGKGSPSSAEDFEAGRQVAAVR
jgi:hypothetical protein